MFIYYSYVYELTVQIRIIIEYFMMQQLSLVQEKGTKIKNNLLKCFTCSFYTYRDFQDQSFIGIG